jgi:hypothetical protein
LVKIVREDRVLLDFDSELTKGHEDAKLKIITPELYDKTIRAGYTDAGESQEVVFEVELNGIEGARGTVKILSTRGGYIEEEIELGNPPDKDEE